MKAKRSEPTPVPGVTVGDHVYFRHDSGPSHGRVLACGKHGVTVRHKGERCPVRWGDVLGHRRRAKQSYRVVDRGEDGAIAEDDKGKRVYLAGDLPEDDDGEKLQKAAPLLKAVKNNPGLSLQETTDKQGRTVKRWKRTGEKVKKQDRRRNGSDDEPRGAARGYGTHNIEAGDKVSFSHADGKGRGHVVAAGADGATVKHAETGEHHRVFWHEVTGHEPRSDTEKPDVNGEVRGSQDRVPAEKFSAADFAGEHDDPDVSPEAILKHFPSDTAGKIQKVQERLASIEQTIDRHKEDGRYTAEREKLHAEIIGKFLSEDRVKAAMPAEGEAPTFTILGGRGGSGKSWFEGQVYDPEKAVVLDADAIKGMLPEYEGWNAHQVHEESGELFDEITRQARELGLNIVHDATMKTAGKAVALAKGFKEDGYRVAAHYMHLPRQEAAKRAVARFLGKTNRYVPVEVVLSNTGNEQSFDEVKKIADQWSFRDNNVPKGQEPKLISESGAGDEPLKKAFGTPIIVVWRTQK